METINTETFLNINNEDKEYLEKTTIEQIDISQQTVNEIFDEYEYPASFSDLNNEDRKSFKKLSIKEKDSLVNAVNNISDPIGFYHIELNEVIKFNEVSKKILIINIYNALFILADSIYEYCLDDYNDDSETIETYIRKVFILEEVDHFKNRYECSLAVISDIKEGIELIQALINSISYNNLFNKYLSESLKLIKKVNIDVASTYIKVYELLEKIMLEKKYGYLLHTLP